MRTWRVRPRDYALARAPTRPAVQAALPHHCASGPRGRPASTGHTPLGRRARGHPARAARGRRLPDRDTCRGRLPAVVRQRARRSLAAKAFVLLATSVLTASAAELAASRTASCAASSSASIGTAAGAWPYPKFLISSACCAGDGGVGSRCHSATGGYRAAGRGSGWNGCSVRGVGGDTASQRACQQHTSHRFLDDHRAGGTRRTIGELHHCNG
mmetsp:Transcript_16655/g.46266  ORF Transcript_16655/g.46266 Transcript_16655/m.46266 type:complete len:214 (+) Transcript_16655:210-851(+)